MNKITWCEAKKAISQRVTVYYINECITVDKLTVSGDYVLIGRRGVSTFDQPEQSTRFYIK